MRRCLWQGVARSKKEYAHGSLAQKAHYAASVGTAQIMFSTPRVVLFRAMELINIQNIGQVGFVFTLPKLIQRIAHFACVTCDKFFFLSM